MFNDVIFFQILTHWNTSVVSTKKTKKIQHDLLHNRFAYSRKTIYFNHHERSNKNKMTTMIVILTCKKRQYNTKKWQHQKKTMKNQGDATPPTHINLKKKTRVSKKAKEIEGWNDFVIIKINK